MADTMTPEQRYRCMSHIHSKGTKPELRVQRWLRSYGYRYRLNAKGLFCLFRFDEEVTLGKIRIVDLLRDLKVAHRDEFGSYVECEPMFTTAERLLEYREGF